MKQHKIMSASKEKKPKVVKPITANRRINWQKKRIRLYASEHYPEFNYHIYAPSYGAEGLPVLVAVHGISHRAKEQARAFSAYAEQYGFVVVAPLFGRKNFPAYQRLGISKQSVPCYSDIALNALLGELGKHTGALTQKVSLFGYSAGGQFVHRYAMAYPERVHAVVTGAAGWYTFPDVHKSFPRGVCNRSKLRTLELKPEQFLKIPMATLVGGEDNQNDSAFKRSASLDLQQGITRIERAERWVKAMQEMAIHYGFNTRYEHNIMPLCGHSFSDCVEYGNLPEKVVNFLFASCCQKSVLPNSQLTLEHFHSLA
ncbi:hypothetical protein [methanotrophic endosymbiont of Bathymodiolus puteoserpentis (Logatchev)]|jgi:pimeloyl-ACP methyl ester carboxylesterase|uniref:hypothetical protein n=1 Tax=methanotrophic endosymbiont of Bathymodiolus puteoserpentis (Logatchev) TaxID=343235 RepID=UPI0013CA5370|nr:hypothetical protein [methanotrophic endosymbiont of Bathymodiolus puteoserpentis (Logatchev)]SHE23413.1 hypothetical protein BPUTEOMOX_873 [methanotrophic endosymbiont of Bathymodiolus puteoserpentis (Logatchev)]